MVKNNSPLVSHPSSFLPCVTKPSESSRGLVCPESMGIDTRLCSEKRQLFYNIWNGATHENGKLVLKLQTSPWLTGQSFCRGKIMCKGLGWLGFVDWSVIRSAVNFHLLVSYFNPAVLVSAKLRWGGPSVLQLVNCKTS